MGRGDTIIPPKTAFLVISGFSEKGLKKPVLSQKKTNF
jgi:hypothetical protein